MCGKRFTFLYTSPDEHVQYNVSSSSLTSVQKKLFTIISVVRSLKGLGWNTVGPASQTVAQHYISIEPMYRDIWCFWCRDVKASPA